MEKITKQEILTREFNKHYETHFEDYLTGPDDDDSTELGEIPQEEGQGSIPKYGIRRYVGGMW